MNTHQKREALKSAYSGKSWSRKVDKMPEDQVDAIYIRLRNQGKI